MVDLDAIDEALNRSGYSTEREYQPAGVPDGGEGWNKIVVSWFGSAFEIFEDGDIHFDGLIAKDEWAFLDLMRPYVRPESNPEV